MRRVVVTGYGAISPLGFTAHENWKNLMEGRSGIGLVTQFDTTQYASKIGGEVKGFDPKQHFSVKDLKKMDRFIQFCMVASKEAITHAGLDPSKIDLNRVGVSVGVGIGGLLEIQNWYKEILKNGPRHVTPFFIPMIVANLAAGQVSLKYGFKGPNLCYTTACSSSAHAIGESFKMIQRNAVDRMVVGGAEAVVCELAYSGFCSARALSTRNEEPQRASRPFDKDRDGFVLSEGSAILVLEELETAKKRNASILAEIIGYAATADASHITQPSPDGEGAARCMQLCLEDSKLNKEGVDYINAHGTSTPIGDVIETRAIKTVFADHAKKLTVSSTKSMTGHLLGASGALEAMYSVQAIQNQIIPPTINLENPDPECDLFYAPNKPHERKVDTALSNSFGFGGTNASLLFRRFHS